MSAPIITPQSVALVAASVAVGLVGLFLVVSALLTRCSPGRALLVTGGLSWRRLRVVSQGRTLRLPLIEAADVVDCSPLAVDLPLPLPSGERLHVQGTVRLPIIGDETEKAARLVYPLSRAELGRLVHALLLGAVQVVSRQEELRQPDAARTLLDLAHLERFGLVCDDLRVVG